MQATLLLLKYILRPELPGELARIFGLLSAIQHQPHGLDCIKLLLNYVAQGTDRVDTETLRVAPAGLQLDDINSERRLIVIRQGKGRKDGVVPLGRRALDWLQASPP